MKQRFSVFVIVALCVLFVPLGAFAAPANQQVDVQPPAGPVGTRFVFITAGFAANERLSAWINAPDGTIINQNPDVPARARSDGGLSWNWVAPSDLANGVYQVVVHGRTSGIERVLSFQIISADQPATPPANTGIAPTAGAPGTIFRFFATGFSGGERLDYYALDPNQQKVTDNFIVSLNAAADGRIDGSWTAPIDTTAFGSWQIVLTGAVSGISRTITFAINAPQQAAPSTVLVSPAVGKPGMRFIFSGAGFTPDEALIVWLNAPNGGVVPLSGKNLVAYRDGRFNINWVSPADAATGTWSVVLHGQQSGIEQVAQFTIAP